MLGEDSRAIVVIAYINAYDARVGLAAAGARNVRERIRRQPGYAIVVGLARAHLVAGGAGATAGNWPLSRCLVIPGREEGAPVANRKVRLPLRLGVVGIGVQLERRAEGHAACQWSECKRRRRGRRCPCCGRHRQG